MLTIRFIRPNGREDGNVSIEPTDLTSTESFDISRLSGEVTGSFTMFGDGIAWIDSLRNRTNLTFHVDYNWTFWQGFWNKVARIYFWPIGPYPLTPSYEYTIPNAEITRVNVQDSVDGKVMSVEFKAVHD